MMALRPDDVRRLDKRAREVGEKIGHPPSFIVAPASPEDVGLAVGSDRIFVIGPGKLADMIAHDVELELDALESGSREIPYEDEGTPRLIKRD